MNIFFNVKAEQDAHFFEGSASPHERRDVMDASQRSPPSPNTAAARFYRQSRRRTMSDTSMESQPGFIDHRGSQASMPVRQKGNRKSGQHLSPRDIVRSAARSKSSQLRAEAKEDGKKSTDGPECSSGEDGSGNEEEAARGGVDTRSVPQSTPTDAKKKGQHRKGTQVSTLSASRPEASSILEANSGRDHRLSFDMSDAPRHDAFGNGDPEHIAVAAEPIEDEPGVVDHRGPVRSHRSELSREYLRRTESRRSDRSRRSHESVKEDGNLPDHDYPTPSVSRRPSDAGKVEEDVCYPMLEMREVDMEGRGRHGETPARNQGEQFGHAFADKYSMGIPGVLPNFPFPFDFGSLEEFCETEREKNGITIPKSKKDDVLEGTAVGASASSGVKAISFSPDKLDGGGMTRRRLTGEHVSRRQRKLSESVGSGHVGRYQRKLALFEGESGQRNDDEAAVDPKTPLLGDRGKNRPGFGATTMGTHRSTVSATDKARPYRFSFYSNAVPSTIHARTLAEIPAEGQTFEELFVGRQMKTPPEEWEGSIVGGNEHANPQEAMLPAQRPGSTGRTTPNNAHIAPSLSSYKAGGIAGMHRNGDRTQGEKPRTQIMRSVEDAEANTWWLDVLCPTDAEMKVLGKVFGIHPLTIEDILMEETREKIELFRNYYLVCFRSFDQDPYSPTYLEALNMYIVVFREGTLSFHFRGTPHPQNVRRRIKQLKDFINVTSDWISYALIDDITDAFGPLIQNIEYEVDSIDELVLILKDAEQSDMLRRIGTCRKKVMGLLRLMGNKADVVKGLAKRCNENWSVAPKSDIGLYLSDIQVRMSLASVEAMLISQAGSLDYHDAKSESLRKNSVAFALQLPRTNFH